ncbi:MAG: NYN domain-containing protein [Alphaproteobacteria bacterium]|nr:NYN domain-containing protein [Alphaproteobacteria bacterium]
MAEARKTLSLAVLIDADNTSAKHAQPIFDEIVKLGEANVRRIYGDFSGSRLSGWEGAIQSLAILQHQQRSNSKGKNASDIALVIDAMDLMYKRTLDGVVLVSSDSDFTRLAQRLREEGLEVYGFGERKAVEAFRNACNRFIYVENLLDAEPEEKKGGTAPAKAAAPKKDPPSKARKIIADAIGEPDADGWENLSSIGSRIQGAHPDFDPRSYGCANLSTLVEKSGGFDIRKDRGAVHVRHKADAAPKGSGAGKASAA